MTPQNRTRDEMRGKGRLREEVHAGGWFLHLGAMSTQSSPRLERGIPYRPWPGRRCCRALLLGVVVHLYKLHSLVQHSILLAVVVVVVSCIGFSALVVSPVS